MLLQKIDNAVNNRYEIQRSENVIIDTPYVMYIMCNHVAETVRELDCNQARECNALFEIYFVDHLVCGQSSAIINVPDNAKSNEKTKKKQKTCSINEIDTWLLRYVLHFEREAILEFL